MLYDVEYVKDGVNLVDLFESDSPDEEVVKSEFMTARVCTEVVAVTRCDESHNDEFEEFEEEDDDEDTTWIDDDEPSEDSGDELEDDEEYDCDDQEETEQE